MNNKTMSPSLIEEKVKEITMPIIEELNLKLYDIEFVKEGRDYYLRIFIDKEEDYISTDDCEALSRKVDPLLDELDIFAEQYVLEVSSKGLTRTLKRDNHFRYSLGEKVEVKLFKAMDDGIKEFEAILTGFDGESITFETDEKKIVINKKDAALVKVLFE
ncbi:MAG: ribosome maturation factor RimP [Lachnospiraceae bacterium]|nr:ribosome maturation factor RimP [Lachnospiraceae bacterium]